MVFRLVFFAVVGIIGVVLVASALIGPTRAETRRADTPVLAVQLADAERRVHNETARYTDDADSFMITVAVARYGEGRQGSYTIGIHDGQLERSCTRCDGWPGD
jgi:hypothetical protein